MEKEEKKRMKMTVLYYGVWTEREC